MSGTGEDSRRRQPSLPTDEADEAAASAATQSLLPPRTIANSSATSSSSSSAVRLGSGGRGSLSGAAAARASPPSGVPTSSECALCSPRTGGGRSSKGPVHISPKTATPGAVQGVTAAADLGRVPIGEQQLDGPIFASRKAAAARSSTAYPPAGTASPASVAASRGSRIPSPPSSGGGSQHSNRSAEPRSALGRLARALSAKKA